MLETYGVGERVGRAVKSLCESCHACMRVLEQICNWFAVRRACAGSDHEANHCNVPIMMAVYLVHGQRG